MRDLHGLCNRLAEVFNEDDTPDKLSTEAREAIEELWEGREVAKSTIDHLERERDDLRKALELLAVLGEKGMQRDYQRWLTFHDKVSEIARDALRSPEG